MPECGLSLRQGLAGKRPLLVVSAFQAFRAPSEKMKDTIHVQSGFDQYAGRRDDPDLSIADLEFTWTKIQSDSRSAYDSLKDRFLKTVENPEDLSADDPLSDAETSPWNIFRLDEDLRTEIFQDVERCMPENLYFREPFTQKMLLDILFIYCKLNQDVGYRQGMHEILAPILWVVSRDAIDPQDIGTNHRVSEALMLTSLDQEFVEHDAFALFGSVMQTVKTFYEMGSHSEPTTAGLLNNSPIVERSKRIHENYLHHADPELAEHLTAIEILPQIFLIRWVRLLFGREFPFEDVLALWDKLFAEDSALDLVDLVSVSMLLRIRWQLLEADYTAALTLLLKYPAPPAPYGPSSFVADALYLRDNLQHDGGDHIISKYSRRVPETTVTRRLPRKVKRAKTVERTTAQKAVSPRLLPARIFQDQGGIEGILQEAAKGVYSRGEKWGVGKALRGAVQGLQSGATSPRPPSKSRLSLEDERLPPDKTPDILAKIEALEQRHRSLAKLLENAVEDLWLQQKDIHQKHDEATADRLSLSIAKVQFVQVYLENSTMPLPPEPVNSEELEKHSNVSSYKSKSISTPPLPGTPLQSAQLDGVGDNEIMKRNDTIETMNRNAQNHTNKSDNPLPSTPTIRSPPLKASLDKPRPSLEKSPFSWMLGEEPHKSSFVSPSPFGTASGPRRTLFRDTAQKGKGQGAGVEDGDDDVFNIASLKGGKGR